MNKTQRYFIFGDQWLYFQFYMGSKTSESFLISKIKPFADQLLVEHKIDKWFFINYNDPKRHIRVRFHILNVDENLYHIIKSINYIIKPILYDKLIQKVTINTYNRELERYGANNIESFEYLFFYNTELIIKILSLCEDDPERRWLYGLKTIDFLLDNWKLDINNKKLLFESLKISFGEEMGINSFINRQLSKKYRANKDKIYTALTKENPILDNYLKEYQLKTLPYIKQIIELKQKQHIPNDVPDLLKSYIHMHFNRLFSSRQRENEWVSYYFLHLYYRSEIAKIKYNKS